MKMRTQDPCTHTCHIRSASRGRRRRNRRRKPSCTTCETPCVVLGVSAHMGRRRREARAELGAAGDELLGARAAAVAIAVRGVRGHSDHAVLDADRHRGRRPARMWDAVLALGAVDAFCVRSAGCVVAEGESEVSRRAYWRAPRRERKRSHSTPPSRDYGGVERRQCRGAQQLARRSSLKSMSAQSAESTCCGVSGGSSDSSSSAPARAGEAGDIAVISAASASRQAAADRGPRTKRTTDHGPETNSASQQKDPFRRRRPK
jgi:hypothetical protein